MSSHRRQLVPLLCAVGLSAAMMPLSSVAQAAAATSPVAWTQNIQGGVAGEVDQNAAILTHPNGDVTFGGCTQDEPLEAIETWTSGHHLVGSRPTNVSPDPDLCNGYGVTDQQGNVYSMMTNPTTDLWELMAFKPNGSDLWPAPTPLPPTCPGNPLSLGWSTPVLGADGNIYGLAYYGQANACPTAIKLYGVNHKTGALLFAKTLNPAGESYASDVSAYVGGLVVRSDNQVTYYNYGGTRIGGPYTMGGQQIDQDQAIAATTAGRTFAATAKTTTPTSSCPLTLPLKAIDAYLPGGLLRRIPITGCNEAPWISAMPDGGVLVLTERFATGNPVAFELRRYSSRGHLLWTKAAAGGIAVDIYGDVIVSGSYPRLNAPNPADDGEPEVRLIAYNGVTGGQIYDFDTVNLAGNDSYPWATLAVGLDQGRIYLGLKHCPGNVNQGGGTCDTAPLLYAIDAPGLGIDYPRGAMLGVMSTSPNDLRRCPVHLDKPTDLTDVADVTSPGSAPFDGVSAEISQAAACVDTGTAKATQWVDGEASSWVMLQSQSVADFAQVGILYHPNGLGSPDTMFVAIETPTFTLPGRNLTDNGARFGPIEIIAKKAEHYLEVNFGTAVSSGLFGVSVLATPVTKDTQCPGEPSDNTRGYTNVQGAKPSTPHPADVIELTYDSQCLWEFFLPPLIASRLRQADVAAEIHSSGSHFPGTVLQPLEFSDVTTTVGSATGWFAMPSEEIFYQKNTGCSSTGGTESSYIFVVWSKDQAGSCD